MAEKYRCGVCDLEESRCQCDKYCFMCQGGNEVRLCSDGMYYCLECREACDMQPQF
jgi:sulfur transfer complex TusBCD TusB component (DsrH family)